MTAIDVLLAQMDALERGTGAPLPAATARAVVCALTGHGPIVETSAAGVTTCARCGGLVDPPAWRDVIVAGCGCEECARRRAALDPVQLHLQP